MQLCWLQAVEQQSLERLLPCLMVLSGGAVAELGGIA